MSDITITIPVWPLVVAAVVAILAAIGCVAWAGRPANGLKWLAWVLATLSGACAVALLAGAVALTWG
jgi:hypothetical protein